MSFYKYLSEHDRVVASNPLYEIINISTSSFVSSSNTPSNFDQYGTGNGTFAQSDHVFDLTFGLYNPSSTDESDKPKKYIYNQFAKTLLGHDSDNNIKQFILLEDVESKDSSLPLAMPYAFIVNLSREQTKDRIKYGTLEMQLIVSGSGGTTGSIILSDSDTFIHEGAGGHHYGILHASSSDDILESTYATSSVGYVFYEAGIAIISPYIFAASGSSSDIIGSFSSNMCGILKSTKADYADEIDFTDSIKDLNYFFQSKINSINFEAVTELNSTIYFCRAFNHEFNYSSNPTYLSGSEIIVKGGDPEEPSRTYITTVGLYSDDNQLLAVAKLSEPILKTKDNELIARVRLDF